jgi:hypothetical protein
MPCGQLSVTLRKIWEGKFKYYIMEKEILQTGKKWFKSLMREFKYRELMKERGWKLLVKDSYHPEWIANRYTTGYSYRFERI